MKSEYQGTIIFTESVIREIERSNLDVCRSWIHLLLMYNPRSVRAVKSHIESRFGLPGEVVERAAEALGVVECVVDAVRGWGLPYRGSLRS